jgi:hypothetical protein
VGRQARRLGHDRAVDVDDLVAGRAHAPRRLGQQHGAVGARELGRRVGEVAPDVAQPGRAQQRIGDRVQQRVGVAVPEQAVRVRDRHAAEPQRPVRHEPVRVPALAHAQLQRIHRHAFLSGRPAAARQARSPQAR